MPQTVRQRLIELSELPHGTFSQHLLAIKKNISLVYTEELKGVTAEQDNMVGIIEQVDDMRGVLE